MLSLFLFAQRRTYQSCWWVNALSSSSRVTACVLQWLSSILEKLDFLCNFCKVQIISLHLKSHSCFGDHLIVAPLVYILSISLTPRSWYWLKTFPPGIFVVVSFFFFFFWRCPKFFHLSTFPQDYSNSFCSLLPGICWNLFALTLRLWLLFFLLNWGLLFSD